MNGANEAVRDPWATDPWRARSAGENSGVNVRGSASSLGSTAAATATPVWPPTLMSTTHGGSRGGEDGGGYGGRFNLEAPSWDGSQPETNIEPYLKSLRGWLVTTKVPSQQQGLILLSVAKGDLKLIINELTLDELTAYNGGERVYQLVHNTFEWALKRTLPRKLETCLYGSSGERQRGEGFLAYTARKLQQY
eukprot:1944818-Amphidinium_carterae.1